MTGCWGDASHESSSSTVRGTRLLALASRAVLRGFGVGSTVSQADDASLAPRERGTATRKTGGSAGRSHGELASRCTPAAASRLDNFSNSASERAAASTRACDASATAAACDVHGASRASRRRAAEKPHARHSGDHTQTHWWHRRRQKNGKEGTWKQTAEQAGYWMGLVAVALFILIGYAYHTKLSEEERKDKCAPCRAALLTVTNRDTAVMDEAEQALGLKASKD